MFDKNDAAVVEPLAGEADTTSVWCEDGFDDLVFLITVDELNTGWDSDDRHVLPDLESFAPGPFLAVLLEWVDRSKLNGFDLVRVLQARERLVSHFRPRRWRTSWTFPMPLLVMPVRIRHGWARRSSLLLTRSVRR